MLTPPQAIASAIVNFAPRFAKSVFTPVKLLLVGATLAKRNAVCVSSQGFPLAVNGFLDWEEQRECTPKGAGAKKACGIPFRQSS
jgi:hypothetical protein